MTTTPQTVGIPVDRVRLTLSHYLVFEGLSLGRYGAETGASESALQHLFGPPPVLSFSSTRPGPR